MWKNPNVIFALFMEKKKGKEKEKKKFGNRNFSKIGSGSLRVGSDWRLGSEAAKFWVCLDLARLHNFFLAWVGSCWYLMTVNKSKNIMMSAKENEPL